MASRISRIFMIGNSQAVRIPQDFRLNARKVEIRQTEQGDLLIHPLPPDRGEALLEALSDFDDAFVEILEADRNEKQAMQERGDL